MLHKYVVKTMSGSFYGIEDHRHLFKESVWMVTSKEGAFFLIGIKPFPEKKSASFDMRNIDISDFKGRQLVFVRTQKMDGPTTITTKVVEIYKQII